MIIINTYSHIKKHICLKKVAFVLFLWLSCSAFNLTAQTNKKIANQYNGWYMYFGNHRISDKLSIHTEYQWRRNNSVTHWQQSLVRVGLDWHIHKNLTLTGGYAQIKSFPYGDQPISVSHNEHQAWQQLVLHHNRGRFYFNHRYRLEQRFLENITTNTRNGHQQEDRTYRDRARYRFLVTIPLSNNRLTDNTLFASISDEVFLGFGQERGKNILGQNRLSLSMGWYFNKNYSLQMGYLNQYIIKADGIHHERNHTLQIGLQWNLDLRKN